MKIPVSWLREWVDLPPDALMIAERLTMLGFEVEAIEPAAPPFSGVVVAEITRAEPHPKADRLQVCTVNAGGAQPVQIVCGAANARAGLKSALAMIGAQLPGGREITAATLRGVTSAGMLCSAKELGLETGGEGILELPSDAAVGQDLRTALDLNDQSLEIAVTPNRGDVMSVLGLARELARRRRRRAQDSSHRAVSSSQQGDLAGKDCAPLRRGQNCNAGDPWRRQHTPVARLAHRTAAPRGSALDQPGGRCHQLRDARARPAHSCLRSGETARPRWQYGSPVPAKHLQLLDGRKIELAPDVLVIADGPGPVGLAGIMGGERTAIGSGSTSCCWKWPGSRRRLSLDGRDATDW